LRQSGPPADPFESRHLDGWREAKTDLTGVSLSLLSELRGIAAGGGHDVRNKTNKNLRPVPQSHQPRYSTVPVGIATSRLPAPQFVLGRVFNRRQGRL
jgi:hypothetical protein